MLPRQNNPPIYTLVLRCVRGDGIFTGRTVSVHRKLSEGPHSTRVKYKSSPPHPKTHEKQTKTTYARCACILQRNCCQHMDGISTTLIGQLLRLETTAHQNVLAKKRLPLCVGKGGVFARVTFSASLRTLAAAMIDAAKMLASRP